MSGGHNRSDEDIWGAIQRKDIPAVGDAIRPWTITSWAEQLATTLREMHDRPFPLPDPCDEAYMEPKKPGYHLNTSIPRGTYGEITKIQEELLELEDAEHQGNKIMALVELSDLYGAIEGYLKQHHPGITMRDLAQMSDATQRAFANGERRRK